MRHGSLFSGIGGFDLAAEWMGWTNIFHCEWNEFGQKVLKYYWPNAKSYTDIKNTDFSVHRGNIDIISGGFPCQPYSQAGKRKGKEDDRHLWPEMLRAIREIQPCWIVGENVSGLLNWNKGLVLDEIKSDLETSGFEVFTPLVLPACGKNAPHQRNRVWIIANSCYKSKRVPETYKREKYIPDNGETIRNKIGSIVKGGTTTNSNSQGLQRSEKFGGLRTIWKERDEQFAGFVPSTWEEFPTQHPLCNGNDGLSEQLDGITFSKWRQQTLKAGGNAIVPQVVFEIFKAIEKMNIEQELERSVATKLNQGTKS